VRYQSRDNPEKPALADLSFYPRPRLLAGLAVRSPCRRDAPDIFEWHHARWVVVRQGKRTGKEKTSMAVEENEAVVRREQEELWNHTGNLDAAEELFAAGQAETAKQEAADFRRGFPDVISTIEDLIAEGDKVVARWRSQATHRGEYMGIPPTGKEVQFTGISVYRIEEDKIAESWNSEDQFGLMRQIGAIPEPRQSEEANPT
jgi:predicted ester cyclase